MTGENKRFETRKSLLDENGYFIADKKGRYVFPIFHSLEDTRAYMFCKALNELAEENGGTLPAEFEEVIYTYSYLDISKRKKSK